VPDKTLEINPVLLPPPPPPLPPSLIVISVVSVDGVINPDFVQEISVTIATLMNCASKCLMRIGLDDFEPNLTSRLISWKKTVLKMGI
jgi:hypothetical protein